MKNWKINSWRKYPVKHIPEYSDKKELEQVLGKIKNFPPRYKSKIATIFSSPPKFEYSTRLGYNRKKK